MYHSWKALLVKDENDLYSMDRIKKLYQQRQSISFFFVGFFFVIGAMAVAGIVYLVHVHAYFKSLIMIPISAVFFWAAALFYFERKRDPIQSFVKKQDGFEFIEGKIVSATYKINEKRNTREMLVKGVAKGSDGKMLTFYETFDAKIWPFVDKNKNKREDELDIRKFEMNSRDDLEIDERIKLPTSIYVLHQKNSSNAAMIGIDKRVLDDAMKSLH